MVGHFERVSKTERDNPTHDEIRNCKEEFASDTFAGRCVGLAAAVAHGATD
jgi:hypothetical protein